MINKGLGVLFVAALLVSSSGCASEAETIGDSATPAAAPAKAAVTPAMLETGRSIYKTNCVACHGETGRGDGPGAGVLKPPPRDHTDAAYMNTMTDEDLAKVIQMGGAIKGRPMMPSHPQIRGAEMDALVAYVRSLSAKK
jgi:cytochrome c oxidase cbb3-type subunit 3